MGSALLNPAAHASTAETAGVQTATETPEELRRQVAARLAAHRERRLRKETEIADSSAGARPQDAGKARIAAAVAQRYANAQSYRAFLAAEAERAIQQARAAAEVAARNARAVAEAQQRLLDTLAEQTAAAEQQRPPHAQQTAAEFAEQSLWPELDRPVPPEPRTHVRNIPATSPLRKAARPAQPQKDAALVPQAAPESALRVVLYDDTPAAAFARPSAVPSHPRGARQEYAADPEALLLDEEISFRQAPVFEEPPGPAMPLPANLIEFPRQLVASRKARPRYAEGPLRDEEAQAGSPGQLRIFEVDPAQISTTPLTTEPADVSEAQWTSLWLDTAPVQPASPATHEPGLPELPATASYVFSTPKLYPARIPRRLLAGSIDLAIAGMAGLGCAAAFTATEAAFAGNAPWRLDTLRSVASSLIHAVPAATLAITGVSALFFLSLLLQTLSFTFSDATPGMRLARIGLCTFSDDNPTRAAMLRRVLALVLSTAVFGLGFGWAFLDEDRLAWHDLISRMYQRSY